MTDRGFALRDKLPPKDPPPPPPQTPGMVHNVQQHQICTKDSTLTQQEQLDNKLFSTPLSLIQKRHLWQVSQTNHIYPYKNPPPLPLRHVDSVVKKVENTGPKYEEPGNARSVLPPPLPPRQSAGDREGDTKLKVAEMRLNKTKNQQMTTTKKSKNGGQSFWRNLKQAKVFSSSTSVNKNKPPPPLPPRIAANNDYSNEFPRCTSDQVSQL